jgi:hypothetical protein
VTSGLLESVLTQYFSHSRSSSLVSREDLKIETLSG